MVRCFRCDSWTHFECAGFEDRIAAPDQDFMCSMFNCKSEGAANVPQSLPSVTTVSMIPSTSSDAFNFPHSTQTRYSDDPVTTKARASGWPKYYNYLLFDLVPDRSTVSFLQGLKRFIVLPS